MDTTTGRYRAAIVAIAATVLLAGFLYHPFIAVLLEPAVIAAAVTADTMRWALSHLLVAVGYGLSVLAFLAIRDYLHEAGEHRWSSLALPFITMGSTLFVILPGMEFAPLAAAATGGDVRAIQAALTPWFMPIFLAGSVSFGLGAIGFALAIVRARVLGPGLTWLVAGSLVAMAVVRFIPLGPAPYLMALAGMLALWPLAGAMWRQPAARPASQPHPAPAA